MTQQAAHTHRAAAAIGMLMSVWLLLVPQPAAAAPRSVAARPSAKMTVAAENRCGMLQSADLATLTDAPTHITEAQWVSRHGATPAYCRVRGQVEPHVRFEILLPGAGWNGKFIEMGCGGACGSIDSQACADPLHRQYACIVSDTGHRSRGDDWIWAKDNLQAKIDYGYRGAHVTALAGKALTRLYYRRPPRESYFDGCSTGGRQAMVEAQRFPWDFNGIVAGAPPLNFTANSLAQLWASLAATDSSGKAILTPAAVRLVHRAVLARCDLDDGVRDGIVGDPGACDFDPARLLCGGGRRTGCLTGQQLVAVRKIYAGPFAGTDSLSRGGYLPGSELEWIGTDFSAAGGRGFLYSYDEGKFRYAAFVPDPGAGWQPKDLDFEAAYRRLGMMESLYSASNPDLRQFRRNGGKLLMYQGWSDPFEPPAATTQYYRAVERLMGGRAAAQSFYRLFMVPGMGHCSGGEGAWSIDYLSYLESWVEQGTAPRQLIGRHPAESGQPGFSRPVYPYPLRAKYKGSGDPRAASSFIPVAGK
jgi:Tannase and feruloyl esterase